MDRLLAMRVFSVVVDTGSFARAAEQLGLSTSATSRHVADLERHIGACLMQRSTRRLTLTETGITYLERCRRILSDLDEAEALAGDAEAQPHGLLRLSLPHGFGLKYVAPLLPALRARYPALRLDVLFSDRAVDLVEEGVDVAIRISRSAPKHLVARQLAPVRVVACAAPDYLARHGTPREPEDLLQHECILYQHPALTGGWQFIRDGAEFAVPVKGSLRANSGELVRLAALAGQGVILQPTFVVGDDLRADRLTRVLADYEIPARAVYAVFSTGARGSGKVKALVAHLADTLGADHPVWDRGLR